VLEYSPQSLSNSDVFFRPVLTLSKEDACLSIFADAWRSPELRANSYNDRFGSRVLALGPTSARSIA